MSPLPLLNRETLDGLAGVVPVPDYLDDEPAIGIVHFGVGNFHRSHQAMYIDRLLQQGSREWAICGIGLTERDKRMAEVLSTQDGLYTLTLRHPDGRDEQSVIGSVRRYLLADDDAQAIIDQMADPAVRIVSLTITEGGYLQGELDVNPLVWAEVDNDLSVPRTAFGFILAALRQRRVHGVAPFTVMSCDNIQGNGRVARESTLGLAERIDPALAAWVAEFVAFPSTMVDRITPATEESDRERVRRVLGVEDAWPVSAEPFTQWVLEDDFPMGRPALERVGAMFTDDIDGFESAKLRLLNASHQAIAFVGQLAGYTYVHEAMADPAVREFVDAYMQDDAIGSFNPPAGLDAALYCATVIERFANPTVADPLRRLSVDSSDRVPIFVSPVAIDLRAAGSGARQTAAVLASWFVYWTEDAVAERSSDRAAPMLTSAAENGPVAFLRAFPSFGPLLADDGFLAQFTEAVELLQQLGVHAFLSAYGRTQNDAKQAGS